MALSVAAANGSQSKTTPSRVTTSPERTLVDGLTSAPQRARVRPPLRRRLTASVPNQSKAPAYLRSRDRIRTWVVDVPPRFVVAPRASQLRAVTAASDLGAPATGPSTHGSVDDEVSRVWTTRSRSSPCFGRRPQRGAARRVPYPSRRVLPRRARVSPSRRGRRPPSAVVASRCFRRRFPLDALRAAFGATASSRLGPAVLAAGTLPPRGLESPRRRGSPLLPSRVLCPRRPRSNACLAPPPPSHRTCAGRRADAGGGARTRPTIVRPWRARWSRRGAKAFGRRARRERERYRRHRSHVAGAVEPWSTFHALFAKTSSFFAEGFGVCGSD